MKFQSEDYYRAATERMRQARDLHGEGASYALAMYTAGLAVECLLRAFRWAKDDSFEGRHDLAELLKASDLLGINEENMRRKRIGEDEIRDSGQALLVAMNEVVVLWHNALRFASEAQLKTFLRRIDRLRGVKGDALKKNSSDLLNAAQMVVDRGVMLWTSGKR